ncbi:hypothetical protein ACLQ26_20545 [Micromonospora sp. DT43]|uniref:hypothetical protein n=1 Tax=Micromonospora sp. DT43 TaxID=3393440 RepID=UPI003CE93BAD
MGDWTVRQASAADVEAVAELRAVVLRGSPARRFYERHGFTVETEDPIDVFMVREPTPAGRDD